MLRLKGAPTLWPSVSLALWPFIFPILQYSITPDKYMIAPERRTKTLYLIPFFNVCSTFSRDKVFPYDAILWYTVGAFLTNFVEGSLWAMLK